MVDHFRQTTLCKSWERGVLIVSSELFFDFPELNKVDFFHPEIFYISWDFFFFPTNMIP